MNVGLPLASEKPKLDLEKVSDGPITCLRFRGIINEHFDGKKLGHQVKAKSLVLDLSGVEKISSFGIREWTAFTSIIDKSVDTTYLIGCAPRVISQMNMV